MHIIEFRIIWQVLISIIYMYIFHCFKSFRLPYICYYLFYLDDMGERLWRYKYSIAFLLISDYYRNCWIQTLSS